MLRQFIANRSIFSWLALCLGVTICVLIISDLPSELKGWDYLSAAGLNRVEILEAIFVAWILNRTFWAWIILVGIFSAFIWQSAKNNQVRTPAGKSILSPVLMWEAAGKFLTNKPLIVTAIALLVAAVMICSLFRYEVLTDASGFPKTRYDRWTDRVDFLLPLCSNGNQTFPMRWGQPGEPDPPWCFYEPAWKAGSVPYSQFDNGAATPQAKGGFVPDAPGEQSSGHFVDPKDYGGVPIAPSEQKPQPKPGTLTPWTDADQKALQAKQPQSAAPSAPK